MLKNGVIALALSFPAVVNAAESALPSALDAGWRGRKVCELLFENASVRTARCTFPPGVGHERHFHPAHWGYILQGATMRITTADGTVDRDLKAGSNWWSDGIAWHEAINIGTTTGVYLIVEPKR
jgi:beta-alanine degradation protein BauB